MNETKDTFIMLPTVDFCFKELMMNPKVRQGFIAALLGLPAAEVADTRILPTELPREYGDEKLGILDVHVRMRDGTRLNLEMQVQYFEYWDERILFYLTKMFSGQLRKGEPYENLHRCIHVSILDFNRFDDDRCRHVIHLYDRQSNTPYSDLLEIQFLELQKLPPEARTENGLLRWMRFFHGKNRKEFLDMAKNDEYIGEACNTLIQLSADERKRLAYELREKALRDYNSQILSAERRGMKIGEEIGQEKGVSSSMKVLELFSQNVSPEEVAASCGLDLDTVLKLVSFVQK